MSKRFVQHLVRGIDELLPRISTLFSDAFGATDADWEAWVMQQQAGHRSYLRVIRREGRWYAMVAFLNGVDHCRALSDSLRAQETGEMRAWSHMTLARTTSEAFVRCAVIIDNTQDGDHKAGIAAAVVLWGNNEQIKLAKSDADLASEQAERQFKAIEKKLARTGWTIERDNRYRVKAVVRSGVRTNIEIDVTGQSSIRVKEVASPYRFGSAVAHSGAWFLSSSIHEDADGEMSLIVSPDAMLLSVATVLFSSLAAARAILPQDASVRALATDLQKWNALALELNRLDHR